MNQVLLMKNIGNGNNYGNEIKSSLFIIFVFAIFVSITFFSNFQLEKKAYAISNNSAGVDFDTFVPLKSFNNLTIIYHFYVEHFK